MTTGRRAVSPRSTVTLKGVPESVSVARSRVRELLGEGHPASDDVVLLVSEVVTNSVIHSGSGGGGEVAMTVAVGSADARFDGAGGLDGTSITFATTL